MTKEQLEEYRCKKEEIRELSYKLNHMNEDGIMMSNDTILNYEKGYPVAEAVVGIDWGKVDRTEERYKKRIDMLTKECEEVEEFVESIPDSLARRIFRMYYIDGLSQQDIGKAVHLDRSRVSRKLGEFFKTHTKHKKHSYNNN